MFFGGRGVGVGEWLISGWNFVLKLVEFKTKSNHYKAVC